MWMKGLQCFLSVTRLDGRCFGGRDYLLIRSPSHQFTLSVDVEMPGGRTARFPHIVVVASRAENVQIATPSKNVTDSSSKSNSGAHHGHTAGDKKQDNIMCIKAMPISAAPKLHKQ